MADIKDPGIVPIQGNFEAVFKWVKNINREETETIPPYTAKEISKRWWRKMLAVCDGNGKISLIDLQKSQTKIYKEKLMIFQEQLDKELITKEQFRGYLAELNNGMLRNQL